MVTDPSGAAIAGAEVIVVNDATRVQVVGKTNDEGIYVVPNLAPGNYRVQVSKDGFKTIIKPDITVNVQDALAINFALPLGAVSEIVTIQGGAPLVNTESAAVSTVIERQFVENLPLNGRSFNTLLQLTPGVVIAPTTGAVATGQFSIAGQRSDTNSFSVDGVSANFGVTAGLLPGQSGTGTSQAFSALGGTSSLVSVEALQEFRIVTSSFAPEFGRSPGGQVLLTTRSGTNDLHGGVYEYFRNDVLDANDWFANAAGQSRAPERHNDFGGFLGGPIWKDKTFFFLSYEGARLRLPQTSVIDVPSSSSRTSAPSALAPLLNAYPIPNGPISADGYTAQFTGTYSNSATLNAGSVRIDHKFNDKFTLFGRYNDAPSETASRVYTKTARGLLLVHITTDGSVRVSSNRDEIVEPEPVWFSTLDQESAIEGDDKLTEARAHELDNDWEEAAADYKAALGAKDPRVRSSALAGFEAARTVTRTWWWSLGKWFPPARWWHFHRQATVLGVLTLLLLLLSPRLLHGVGLLGWSAKLLKLIFMPKFRGKARVITPGSLTSNSPTALFAAQLPASADEVCRRWEKAGLSFLSGGTTLLSLPSAIADELAQNFPKVYGVNLGKYLTFFISASRYLTWRVESQLAYCPPPNGSVNPPATGRMFAFASLRWGWFTQSSFKVSPRAKDALDVDNAAYAVAARILAAPRSDR